jgi:hypothetical protein
MLSRAAECARLSLIVERWLDADLLLAEEGGTLLAALRAAGRALEEGDEAAVGSHLARLVRTLEALTQSRTLATAEGRAALDTARQMLEASAGCGPSHDPPLPLRAEVSEDSSRG